MDDPGVPDHELVRDAWVHVTQEVDRTQVSRPNALCLLANSCVYSLEKDVAISGHGLMQCMGWPLEYLDHPDDCVSDAEFRDIAGNSFSCPIACLVSSAMVMTKFANWWAPSD